MTSTLQGWLMAGQLAVMIGAIIAGWGRISASFATVRADISNLARRIDRYVERTDLELGRHWAAISDTAEIVHKHQGRFEEMDR